MWGPGLLGQKGTDMLQTQDSVRQEASPVQNEEISGALAQRTSAQWRPEKWKNFQLSHEWPTWGPVCPQTWHVMAHILRR